MIIRISHLIAIQGYQGEPDDFYCTVIDIYLHDYYPDHPSVERFLCYPKKTLTYCNTVRERTGLPDLENSDILLCLLNLRKQNLIKVRIACVNT